MVHAVTSVKLIKGVAKRVTGRHGKSVARTN